MTLKRFLSISLALALTATFLTLPAYAAGNDFTPSKSGDKFYLCALEEIPYVAFPGIPNREEKKTVSAKLSLDGTQANSFNDLYGMFSAPATALWASMKPTNPMKVWFAPGTTSMQGTDNKRPITEKTSLAMMMANLSGDELNVSATQKIEVKDRNARLGICNINGTVKLSVPGMSVTNGNLLIRNAVLSGTSSTTPVPVLEVHLSEPITVGTGGNLYLDIGEGQASPLPGTGGGPVADKLVAPTGKSAIILDGGTAHLGAFLVERAAGNTSAVPLVAVNSGNLIIEEGSSFSSGADGMPDYTPGTLGPVADWHTTITNGDSNQPTVQVANGATLTLKGGEIKATGTDTPAVQVAAGATVEIPTDSKTIVTASSNNSQAIDLAGGAIVKKGDIVTVIVSQENEDAGDNYVDNYGNIILAKGAKTSEDESNILNAAVILPNGTIIQGSPDEAPTLKTETGTDGKTTTTVTIPENGSVTEPGKDKQDLANGGTATSIPNNEGGTTTTVTPAEIKATSITLDKNTLTLYTNREAQKTGTLNATIMPENATNKAVTWTSSNENVATVTNGVVTAVANGTATITAKVGSDDSALSATCTVTVTTYSSGGPSTPSYSVTAPAVDNGKVTVSPKYAKKNSTVTLTVTPDEGYELSSLAVTDAKGNVLELTDKGNGKYTFKMPASKVDVTATFKEIPTTHVCPAEKYTDVDTTQWYHEGVDYVIEKGMMNGTGTNIFEPNATTTRGMIVTILYRLEKEPTAGTSPFTDVDANQWYAKAVAWAAANGVVNGTSPTTFHPNDPITREQMAAILYRYASFKGYDVTAKADLAGFTDASQISDYAKDAMSWANQEGLIGGISATTLQPQGSATRAQVATILMRFCENMAK